MPREYHTCHPASQPACLSVCLSVITSFLCLTLLPFAKFTRRVFSQWVGVIFNWDIIKDILYMYLPLHDSQTNVMFYLIIMLNTFVSHSCAQSYRFICPQLYTQKIWIYSLVTTNYHRLTGADFKVLIFSLPWPSLRMPSRTRHVNTALTRIERECSPRFQSDAGLYST